MHFRPAKKAGGAMAFRGEIGIEAGIHPGPMMVDPGGGGEVTL
jgi:hypothetical protein